MKLPIIGSFNTSDSINVDAQKTVNWYLEKSPNGRNAAALYPTPGSSLFTTVGVGPIRAIETFNDLLYVVSGQEFYEVDTSGISVLKGTLSSTGTSISMAVGQDSLMIVDGVKGYIWDGATFSEITDVDFPNGADQVIFIEGYFVVNDPYNTQGLNINGSFFWSDLRDGTSWTGTSFATAERDPDKLLAIEKSHRELWLFGETSTEIWSNTGGYPVFTPVGSGYSEWGIAAKNSAARVDQTMIWLSKNEYGEGQVVQARGYDPKIISTKAVTAEFSKYSTLEDAFSFVLQWKGHTWYVLTFPTAAATWVYDNTEGVWFEWESWNIGRLRYSSRTLFDKKQCMGDYVSGKIYYLDADLYTEDGSIIERVRRTSHFFSDKRHLFYNAVEIELEYGTSGNVDGQVMLRWSDDYGHTWSNEYWKPVGKIGEYSRRLIWRRLGYARDRVFEVRITDPIKPVLISGYIDARQSGREL